MASLDLSKKGTPGKWPRLLRDWSKQLKLQIKKNPSNLGDFSGDGVVLDSSLAMQMAGGVVWDCFWPWNQAIIVWMAVYGSNLLRGQSV